MDWASVIKIGTTYIAVVSVDQVIINIAETTLPTNLTPKQKIMTKLGKFIISSMVAEMVVEFTFKRINTLFALLPKVRIILKEGEDNDE